MLAAYRKAFAKVAQDLGLVREDQLAPYLRAMGEDPLDQQLVADGLLRALDVERIYGELARRLDQRDPARLARRADETLVQVLGEAGILVPDEASRLRVEHQNAARAEAPVAFLTFLTERGALRPEQGADARARLDATYAACPVCGTHVRKGAGVATRCPECGMPLSVAPAEDDPLIGRVLGNCRLVRKIGQGGMGAVYLGRHQILDNDVAVKILPPQISSRAELRERFEREARLAAQLKHPGVVQVLDLGYEGGIHYIAMEFVPGESVAGHLGRAPLPAAEAVRVAREVALALEHAHGAGLVHRDIKPDNILLAPDGRVVVADFGLARAVEGTHLSVTGEVLGTPAYMSPEQAKGESVDARSDVYSLGITLYAMLFGRSPFERGSPMATLLAVCDEAIPPLGRAVGGVPLSLQGLVGQMGAKKPGLRPQSMRDVVRQLERVASELDGRPRPPQSKPLRPVSGQVASRPVSGQVASRPASGRPVSGRASARPLSARTGALAPRPFPVGTVAGAALLAVLAWAMWPAASPTPDPVVPEVSNPPTAPTPPPPKLAPPKPATAQERIEALESGELAKLNSFADRLATLDKLLDAEDTDSDFAHAVVQLRARLIRDASADATARLLAVLSPLTAAHAYADAAAAIDSAPALRELPTRVAQEIAQTHRDALATQARRWYAQELLFLDTALAALASPEDTAPILARVRAVPTHGLAVLEAARAKAVERIDLAERTLERAREEAQQLAEQHFEAALASAHEALEQGELDTALARFAAITVGPEVAAAAARDTRHVDLTRVVAVETAWRAHLAGLAGKVPDADRFGIELRTGTVEGRLERIDLVKGQLVLRRKSGAIEVGEAIAFSKITPRQKAVWALASKSTGVDVLALGLFLLRCGDGKAARVQLTRAPSGEERDRYLGLIERPAAPRPAPDSPAVPAAERLPDKPSLPHDPATVASGRSVRVRYDFSRVEPGWAEFAFRRRPPSGECPGGAYCRPQPGVGLRVRNGVLRWRAPHGSIDRASVQVSIAPGNGQVAVILGGRRIVLPTWDGGPSYLACEPGQAVGAHAQWWPRLAEPRWITLEATPGLRPRLTRALVGEEEIHLVDAEGAEAWEFPGGQSSFEIEAQGDIECVVRSVLVVARWTRTTLADLAKLRAKARRCVRPAKLDHELCPFKDDDDIHTLWDNPERGWFMVPGPGGFHLEGRQHGRYLMPKDIYARRAAGYYLVQVRAGEIARIGFQMWQPVRHENSQRGLLLPTTDTAQECEAWWRELDDLEVWIDHVPQDWHPDNSFDILWPPTEAGERNLVFEAERGTTAIERVAIGSPE